MKIVIKIFNAIIMALSLVATVFLFISSTFSFNSHIALDVEKFAKFVPETKFTENIDIVNLLGTDTIHVGIKFNLTYGGIGEVRDGNRDKINEKIISNNVNDIITMLHEPIDLITEFSIREVIKSTVKDEIYKQVDDANQRYGGYSTTEDIMDEVGMDDEYFNNFSIALYDAANEDGATVDSVSDVLYSQIDEAMARAEESGMVDTSGFSEDTKTSIRENLLGILESLQLVNDDGTLKKISQISYIYIAEYAKKGLDGKVDDPAVLEKEPGESEPDYADRLMHLFIITVIPDFAYMIIGYVCTALLIGLFVFAAIWGILIIITFLRTLSTKKPWTIFGPWFWIVGSLQLILGVGLTAAGKFILPKFNIQATGLPIRSIILAPRTYALIPSIIFLAMIIIAIVYAFFKKAAKMEMYRNVE